MPKMKDWSLFPLIWREHGSDKEGLKSSSRHFSSYVQDEARNWDQLKKIKFKCVLCSLITGICLHSCHFSAVKETSISESEFRWADCLCGWELELNDLSSSFPKIHYSVPIEKKLNWHQKTTTVTIWVYSFPVFFFDV